MKDNSTLKYLAIFFTATALVLVAIAFWTTLDNGKNTSDQVATTTQTEKMSTSTEEVNEISETRTTLPLDTTYIEIVDACGPYYSGDCLNVRAAPSIESEVVNRFRNGQVLKVGELIANNGRRWYKIVYDEWLRHPDRVKEDQYVAAEFTRPIEEDVLIEPEQTAGTSSKRIIVNLSTQTLHAYEGEELFMEEPVSTGQLGSVTPSGTFSVFYRTPSRYMQGPIEGITDDEYDLPGVPWNLYFTRGGAVIHGAYWHDNFGLNWSHGCINLPTEKAQKLFSWTPLGTPVTVRYGDNG